MPTFEPLRRDQLSDLEPIFGVAEKTMGFVPNSLLTMARDRRLVFCFGLLANTVMGGEARPSPLAMLRLLAGQALGALRGRGRKEPEVSEELRQLVALASSLTAGCRYCQAHTSNSAGRAGAAPRKVEQILRFEESPLYSEAERAALRLAFAAAEVPNAATPEHFAALRKHFSEREILQIVAVIALFGFLNRWNDTLATELEAAPASFARAHLGADGWEVGKHAREHSG